MNNTLTAVPGIRVGHATDTQAVTGCTVILCPPGTVGGVDQRGGAPGTRETDLLRPLHLVEHVHAVLLAGGSAYGLTAADGVMRFLEENGVGFPVDQFVVPIVPSAILMDLMIGSGKIRPDADMGYAASATADESPVEQGSVGVGTGCTIGKLAGLQQSTKSGVGSASVELGNGLVVAALVAVNALGDVLDEDGHILGGLRLAPNSRDFAGTLATMRVMSNPIKLAITPSNTVIGVVATNARLTKDQANKVAQMAHDGLARAVQPAHTMYDGDTLFTLATGEMESDVNLIGAFAAEVVAEAIRNGVRTATSLGGVNAIEH
ncbi:MAG: P1 family peptidase [Anaerolineae bacterium]|nr:P1 family peptidase [Anaerolineae bacterium]